MILIFEAELFRNSHLPVISFFTGESRKALQYLMFELAANSEFCLFGTV